MKKKQKYVALISKKCYSDLEQTKSTTNEKSHV